MLGRVHRSQERKVYPSAHLDIGPTFVHRNMRDDPLVDEKGYPSYNKPYSVMAWLETRPPLPPGEDEYVLMTDADMVFTAPIDPHAYGAARGVVISAEYSYLFGTESGFAKRFIDPALVPRLAQVRRGLCLRLRLGVAVFVSLRRSEASSPTALQPPHPTFPSFAHGLSSHCSAVVCARGDVHSAVSRCLPSTPHPRCPPSRVRGANHQSFKCPHNLPSPTPFPSYTAHD
jgi:hypothetical protein